MINNIKITQFGGINNKEVKLNEGLNIILGNNETGKSTTIEALFSVLLMDTKLNKSKKENKEFFKKAYPYEKANTATVEVNFNHKDNNYSIIKKWSDNNPSFRMIKDGLEIDNPKEIENLLKEYLIYEKGTYANIVFTRQEKFLEVIERIKKDNDVKNDMSNILKITSDIITKYNMEEFKSKLETNLKDLETNWDSKLHLPVKNKNYKKPHRLQGEILKYHYKIEELEDEIKNIKEIDIQISKKEKDIRTLKNELEKLSIFIKNAQTTKDEISKSSLLKKDLTSLEKELNEAKEIKSKWPESEIKLKTLYEEKTSLENSITTLKQELENSRIYKDFKENQKLISLKSEKEKELEKLESKQAKLECFMDSRISKLQELDEKIKRITHSLEASKLSLLISKSNKDFDITNIYGEKSKLNIAKEYIADGYMQIKIGEEICFEIKTKEVSIDEEKKELEIAKEEQIKLLNLLNVHTTQEAKEFNSKLKELNSEIKYLKKEIDTYSKKIDIVLSDKAYEYKNNIPRNTKTIEKELEKVQKSLEKIKESILKNEFNIKSYKTKFFNLKNLDSKFEEMNNNLKSMELEYIKLKKLPNEFEDVDSYMNFIDSKLKDKENLEIELKDIELELNTIEIENSNIDIFEQEKKLNVLKEMKNGSINKANTIRYIIDKYNETSKELTLKENNPFKESLYKYISIMSDNKYTNIYTTKDLNCANHSENNFVNDIMDIHISKKDSDEILPLELLSSGTEELLSLAFKLAFNDHLNTKLTVLDDCLVNMDEQRRQKAILAIKEHSKKKQVIFSTCDYDTANKLNGNIIKFQ